MKDFEHIGVDNLTPLDTPLKDTQPAENFRDFKGEFLWSGCDNYISGSMIEIMIKYIKSKIPMRKIKHTYVSTELESYTRRTKLPRAILKESKPILGITPTVVDNQDGNELFGNFQFRRRRMLDSMITQQIFKSDNQFNHQQNLKIDLIPTDLIMNFDVSLIFTSRAQAQDMATVVYNAFGQNSEKLETKIFFPLDNGLQENLINRFELQDKSLREQCDFLRSFFLIELAIKFDPALGRERLMIAEYIDLVIEYQGTDKVLLGKNQNAGHQFQVKVTGMRPSYFTMETNMKSNFFPYETDVPAPTNPINEPPRKEPMLFHPMEKAQKLNTLKVYEGGGNAKNVVWDDTGIHPMQEIPKINTIIPTIDKVLELGIDADIIGDTLYVNDADILNLIEKVIYISITSNTDGHFYPIDLTEKTFDMSNLDAGEYVVLYKFIVDNKVHIMNQTLEYDLPVPLVEDIIEEKEPLPIEIIDEEEFTNTEDIIEDRRIGFKEMLDDIDIIDNRGDVNLDILVSHINNMLDKLEEDLNDRDKSIISYDLAKSLGIYFDGNNNHRRDKFIAYADTLKDKVDKLDKEIDTTTLTGWIPDSNYRRFLRLDNIEVEFDYNGEEIEIDMHEILPNDFIGFIEFIKTHTKYQLKDVFDLSYFKDKIRIAIDTAHIHYDSETMIFKDSYGYKESIYVIILYYNQSMYIEYSKYLEDNNSKLFRVEDFYDGR